MLDERIIKNTYKYNYNLEDEISFKQIKYHFDLEKGLAQILLNSSEENRMKTFIDCYSELYQKIYWVNKNNGKKDLILKHLSDFADLLEPPPKRILEIGSGKAELIKYLAKKGYICKGTEITPSRGEIFSTDENIIWGLTDGVALDKFEEIDSYDYVISNQVLEHLHPDDIMNHFNSIIKILKPGGKYIFNTPHRFTGPHDISKIFGCKNAQGMHLKEYTFNEVVDFLKKCKYVNVFTPNYVKYINLITKNKKISSYLLTLSLLTVIVFEKIHLIIPKLLHKYIFSSVFVVAEKNSVI